jgi:hypothetical protein
LFGRFLAQLQRVYNGNSYFDIGHPYLIPNVTFYILLASDAEYWYFIFSENCVCDILQNLLCYVDLTKYKSFCFNRSWWRSDV